MYKVFLVEDEIVVREGIRNSIPWDKTPYTLAGEAPDGEMALSMIQDIKPDIVITDIRMPFMDGLTFSRIIRKTLPWIKIIILSGHDEFEYAREAVSLGVEEYLLKPVSSSDMLKTLEKIAKRIDEEKEKLLNIENLKKQIRSSSDSLRDKWLSDFVNGRIPPAETIEKGRELGIDLPARSYAAAAIGVTGLDENEGSLISVKMIIQSIMEKHPGGIWFCENDKRFALLVREIAEGESPASNESGEELAYTITRAVKFEVERNTGFKIAVGIGPVAWRLSEVAKSYASALKILNYQTARDMAQISDSSILPSGDGVFNPAGLLNIDGDMLFTKMKYMAKKDIETVMKEYTKFIGNDFGENNMMVYFIFGEIIVAASKIVEALGGDLGKIAPFSLDQAAIQDIANSKDTFFEKIRALLEAVIEFRDAHTGGRYQSVIMKAREYIDQNFASEDISLYSTASHVGISPNHLSTVFAQETGENFIEYLTRVRIDRAKNLLKNTAMKSAEITYEIGFSDPHYFSYIFKKNTGLSPKEYRGLKKP
jgi:two-component system response regulator YesN